MRNLDMICGTVLVLFVIGIIFIMKKNPANGTIRDRQSPLPSGLYTSGSLNNGMDTRSRANFQQQPYGGPTTG